MDAPQLSSLIVIYLTEWCGDCRMAKRFLDQHQIPYQAINIDHDKKGEEFVRKVNQGYRSVPTLVFPDGSILVEPSQASLARKLGLGQS